MICKYVGVGVENRDFSIKKINYFNWDYTFYYEGESGLYDMAGDNFILYDPPSHLSFSFYQIFQGLCIQNMTKQIWPILPLFILTVTILSHKKTSRYKKN